MTDAIDRLKADPFMTVSEVAALTRLSRMTIYREIHADRLTATKIGRTFRVRQSAMIAWLDENKEVGA